MASSTRRSRFRTLAAVLIALAFGIPAGWFASQLAAGGHEQTLASLSPDERSRVRLLEIRRYFMGIDRNFVLRLDDVISGTSREIFSSPDEGRPEGSERFVWSEDSSKFLLVGRHFFVNESTPKLPNGDSLYLMYDVRNGTLWCNSHQQAYPPFTKDHVVAVRWREPIVLADRPSTRP